MIFILDSAVPLTLYPCEDLAHFQQIKVHFRLAREWQKADLLTGLTCTQPQYCNLEELLHHYVDIQDSNSIGPDAPKFRVPLTSSLMSYFIMMGKLLTIECSELFCLLRIHMLKECKMQIHQSSDVNSWIIFLTLKMFVYLPKQSSSLLQRKLGTANPKIPSIQCMLWHQS